MVETKNVVGVRRGSVMEKKLLMASAPSLAMAPVTS